MKKTIATKGSDDKVSFIYVVNACLPNNRAHGIQIVNTCAAISEVNPEFNLVTPFFFGSKTSIQEHYRLNKKFRHTKIFSIDIPRFPYQFQVRSATFVLFVNFYLLTKILISKIKGEKLVIYARGEVVFSLLPISFIVPVFFETHQIRNYEKIYRYALERVRGIVVITDRLKRKFIEEYNIDHNKILVARDSVDIEKFSNLGKDREVWSNYGIDKNSRIILYSGSLTTEKGVHTLAETSPDLPNDVHIVFLGGNEQQVLSFKEKYSQHKNISILGYIDHVLIPQYINAADILILPDLSTDTYSNLYTSPMKLFEYMASSKIIIASDVPSLREVLTDDSAVFFESGNSKSLSDKIILVLNNLSEYQKLGKKASEIVSNFTWKKRGEGITKHVKKVIE